MPGYLDKLASLGVVLPEVLLPVKGTDYAKWAVVACDQYSSEREYWKRVEAAVAGASSTLGMIFPEAYLEDADAGQRIERIQAAMRDYLASGLLAPAGAGLVLLGLNKAAGNPAGKTAKAAAPIAGAAVLL